jgi:hypothetical protein
MLGLRRWCLLLMILWIKGNKAYNKKETLKMGGPKRAPPPSN